MKQRSLSQLYQLVLNRLVYNSQVAKSFSEEYVSGSGICLVIGDLVQETKLNIETNSVITTEEYTILFNHFLSNKPTLFKHTKFYIKRAYTPRKNYWWRLSKEGLEERIKFIQYLISKL